MLYIQFCRKFHVEFKKNIIFSYTGPSGPHPGFYRGIRRNIQLKIEIYNFFVKYNIKQTFYKAKI